MSLDGVITFISVVVALYAVSRRPERLMIGIRWRSLLCLSVIAFFVTIYLEFFEFVAPPCPQSLGYACQFLELNRNGFDPASLSFFVLLALLAYLVFVVFFNKKVPRSRAQELCQTLERLLNLQEFVVVTDLLAPNIDLVLNDKAQTLRTRQQLLSSEKLAAHIARHRPELAIEIFYREGFLAEEFARHTYRTWLADPGSFFIFEITLNEVPYGKFEVAPTEQQPLHYSLLADIERAQELSVYYPLGEETLRLLTPTINRDYAEHLNQWAADYSKEGQRDPVVCSMKFFDFMVRTATYRRVNWHMWLFYFYHFAKRLTLIYKRPTAPSPEPSEWENRTEYVLNELFCILADWAFRLPTILPKKHPYLTGLKPDDAHQNDNIVKSAIICLGQCFRILLIDEEIPEKFKVNVAYVILRRLRDLAEKGVEEHVYQAGWKTILSGAYHSKNDPEYANALQSIWPQIDHVIRFSLSDLDEAIAKLDPKQ